MAGESYPASFADGNGVERLEGTLTFTDAGDQPSPSAPPITSGALPDLGAWVSGTAKVNPATREITVYVEVVGDATNNAATCARLATACRACRPASVGAPLMVAPEPS